mmetsp:Transcript_4975/g.10011  ORF Transcript_4975/g.10011 Transcript_4975/m.10011 type:complete len:115 (-) Transcript_4975:749-1093(-)
MVDLGIQKNPMVFPPEEITDVGIGSTETKGIKKTKGKLPSNRKKKISSTKSGRLTGPCCIDQKCTYPMMELYPEHRSPGCNMIVHVLCREFDDATDQYFCPPCMEQKQINTSCP